jgi:ABC-type transport system involved in multi-copper enzyme maturation permease subunit
MNPILTIAGLTLREAQRRWLLVVGVLLGGAFVLVYATGVWFIVQNSSCGPRARPCATPFQALEFRAGLNMGVIVGLFVANFLTVITAVLLPVDTLSGEIASGVTQTLASKPIRRAEIVLGKWLAYWLLVAFYIVLTAGGVLFAVWAVSAIVTGGSGFVPPHALRGLALILLEATVMLTISIAGGTRFSTVTNGMVALGVFGLGFLGGFVEQFGVMLVEGEAGRMVMRNIGTIISLLVPADALWRLAAYYMMPAIVRDLEVTPFNSMYPPSGAMVLWAIGYIVVVGAIGVRQFNNRAL